MKSAANMPDHLYRHADLTRLFNPQSIALIGATPNEKSFAGKTLRNLEQFAGQLYPVNSKYQTIAGRPCYPSIDALPETPDCVIVAVGRDAVSAIVDECIAAKVGGIVLYASGFAETGDAAWIAAQQALAAKSKASGIPILGPNCLGLFNFTSNAIASFVNALSPMAVRQPAIGIVSQSGALGLSLGEAQKLGISISHILLPGNSCDVDIADSIAFLAEDPACRAIGCVFEGMTNPLRLIEAGEAARRAGKAVVVCKIATGEAGAAAAISHTGSLAGSNAAWNAVFERAGMIVVEDFEALIETASFFAKAPLRPVAGGVAAISASGGAAIMAADKAERHGVPMPQPLDQTRHILERLIPEFGAARNPCDATAQVASDPQMQEDCIRALLDDPSYGVLVQIMGSSGGNTARLVKLFGGLAGESDKLICVVWNSAWHDSPPTIDIEADPRLVLFRSMDRCFATLAAWLKRAEAVGKSAGPAARLAWPGAAAEAAALIASAPAPVLTESEAKRVLALYGLPVVPERVSVSLDDALSAACEFGYPVVLKVESADIPHKSDAGAVRLGVGDDEALRIAYAEVLTNARGAVPDAHIRGVLVQPMVAKGVEIMLGGRIDPQFGPLVVASMGGVLVELLGDSALALAPVSIPQAKQMLSGLKAKKLLDGFRGSAPVDSDALAALIVRVSEFLVDQRDLVAELDINPLVCSERSIMAVDALISRAGHEAVAH
ncbi:MAG: CoA-binding protein [Sphingomonadales bacterium]|nr:MAG: CoA-binding protein [Sphingomonadales bacterium]